MDYEREPETELGDSSTESELPTTVGGDAATDDLSSSISPEPAETADSAADGASDDTQPMDDASSSAPLGAADDTAEMPSDTDLDSDADVLDDAFGAAPTPPEWPAADLVSTPQTSADEAERDIAAAYAASATDADLGDDSDAPVLTDADEDVNSTGAGVQSINARTVTFTQGGAAQVRAQEMNVSQSGVGIARVGNLTLTDGASAFAVVADEATVEEGSNAFIVIARSLNGDTPPTIDWRGALAFGAGVGLVISLLRRLR